MIFSKVNLTRSCGILVILFFFPSTGYSQTAVEYYQEAKRHLNNGEYQKAVTEYSKAIGEEPNHQRAYFERAQAYDGLKSFQKSVLSYTKHIEINGEDAQAYQFRAIAFTQLNEFDKALADFNRSIEINPSSVAYTHRGIFYFYKRNDTEKALADLVKALELDLKNPQAYYERAQIRSTQFKWQDAIADYTKTLEILPQFTDALDHRGRAYLMSGELDKAIADYSQSIEFLPLDLDDLHMLPYLERAQAYLAKGDYEKAIFDYDSVLKVHPRDKFVVAAKKRALSFKDVPLTQNDQEFSLQQGLFTVVLPPGWRLAEQDKEVEILDPGLSLTIKIKIFPYSLITEDQISNELKRKAKDYFSDSFLNVLQREIAQEKEIELGGVPARWVDFSFSAKPATIIGTTILLFYKENFFEISFMSSDPSQRSVCEVILKSLQFSK